MKKIFIGLTLLVLCLSLLVGCGGEDVEVTVTATETATSTATTTETSTSTSTVTATVQEQLETAAVGEGNYGGVFTYSIAFGTSDLEIGWPFTQSERYSSVAYDTLLRETYTGEMGPRLASEWEVADDLSSITLTLREDVDFQDGSHFDAEAVKWNLEQYMAAGRAHTKYYDTIEVLSEYVVRINLSGWENTLLSVLAGSGGFMESPYSYELYGEQWMKEHPVGTGPFKFVSHDVGIQQTFTRNVSYWDYDEYGNQLPYLDGVKIEYIGDEMTRQLALMNGDIDMAYGGGSNIYGALAEAGYDIIVRANDPWCLWPSSANEDSVWADPLVREALSYAIDREAVTPIAEGGYADVAYQLAPLHNLAYNPDIPVRSHDVAKAKQLLTDAGHPDGIHSTVYMMSFMASEPLEVIVDQVAEAGIILDIELKDMGSFTEAWQVSGWEGLIASPCTAYFNFAQGMQTQLGYDSLEAYSTARPDGFYEAIDACLATPEMDQELLQALVKLIDDSIMTIPAFFAPAPAALPDYVHNTGYLQYSNSVLFNLERTWLDK